MPIESRGRRDPELAARLRGEAPPPPAVEYVVGRRPMRVGSEIRQPGDLIPEAATWPRLDSWLNTGMVIAQLPGTWAAAHLEVDEEEPDLEPAPVLRTEPVHTEPEPPAPRRRPAKVASRRPRIGQAAGA